MKALFENIIASGDYDLTQLTNKIDEFYVKGKLSSEDRDSLLNTARVTPRAQFDMQKEIRNIWAHVRSIEKMLNGDSVSPGVASDWVQPTGSHDAYMRGDRVIFVDGNVYESLIDANVWSPEVYPAGWRKL